MITIATLSVISFSLVIYSEYKSQKIVSQTTEKAHVKR